ncbi:MAG: TetR/AcrR family transcriptional regulator [Clostridia bacterium]
MPAIFKGESRNRAKIQMYDIGLKLIKKYGIKKTSVEDITRETGIAKGTFYNFFETKETFIHEIILHQRQKIKAKFSSLIEKKESLDIQDVENILTDLTFDGNNLYAYLDDDDMRGLELKIPEATNSKSFDKDIALMLLNNIKSNRTCDYKIVANYIKILSLANINKDKMQTEVFKQTVALLISSLCNYIFG